MGYIAAMGLGNQDTMVAGSLRKSSGSFEEAAAPEEGAFAAGEGPSIGVGPKQGTADNHRRGRSVGSTLSSAVEDT